MWIRLPQISLSRKTWYCLLRLNLDLILLLKWLDFASLLPMNSIQFKIIFFLHMNMELLATRSVLQRETLILFNQQCWTKRPSFGLSFTLMLVNAANLFVVSYLHHYIPFGFQSPNLYSTPLMEDVDCCCRPPLTLALLHIACCQELWVRKIKVVVQLILPLLLCPCLFYIH